MSTPSGELMYLPKEQWSPRYDSAFYSVKIEGNELLSELPSSTPDAMGGKKDVPAYFYKAVVYREREVKSIYRRYSQFKWLYNQLKADPPAEPQPPGIPSMHMPGGTCPFYQQDDAFAASRLEQLDDFLSDVLTRPGFASHPAVAVFLELQDLSREDMSECLLKPFAQEQRKK